MEKLDLSKWAANRGIFEEFDDEFINLQIVSLSDELVGKLKELDTYQEMLDFAAKAGLASGRVRWLDDGNLVQDIDVAWSFEQMKASKDAIVGQIIDISGIEEFMLNKQEEEAKENAPTLVDGDSLTFEADVEEIERQLHAQNVIQ